VIESLENIPGLIQQSPKDVEEVSPTSIVFVDGQHALNKFRGYPGQKGALRVPRPRYCRESGVISELQALK